jgi:hypothetical protein
MLDTICLFIHIIILLIFFKEILFVTGYRCSLGWTNRQTEGIGARGVRTRMTVELVNFGQDDTNFLALMRRWIRCIGIKNISLLIFVIFSQGKCSSFARNVDVRFACIFSGSSISLNLQLSGVIRDLKIDVYDRPLTANSKRQTSNRYLKWTVRATCALNLKHELATFSCRNCENAIWSLPLAVFRKRQF